VAITQEQDVFSLLGSDQGLREGVTRGTLYPGPEG